MNMILCERLIKMEGGSLNEGTDKKRKNNSCNKS